jgi:hypothetical protein
MNWRKAFERWETKVGNCDVTPQAVWPIASSFLKRDGQLGLKHYLLETQRDRRLLGKPVNTP